MINDKFKVKRAKRAHVFCMLNITVEKVYFRPLIPIETCLENMGFNSILYKYSHPLTLSIRYTAVRTTIVYKKYPITLPAETVANRLEQALTDKGFVRKSVSGTAVEFRNRSLTFSSTKPLTCISWIVIPPLDPNNRGTITVGASFTKIRYFTIAVMVLFCVVLPAMIGYVQSGVPEVPPTSIVGFPLGFLLHYHVRGRAFRALGRLVALCDHQ